jgi:phosphate-selective porin OprO/OprP
MNRKRWISGLLLLGLVGFAPRLWADVEQAVPDDEEESPGPPAPAPEGEEDQPKVKIFWKDGKTYFQMKDAELRLSHRFQFRFNYLNPDDAVQLPGTERAGQGKGTFRIRRAKTTFEGWFWKPELTYEVQLNWAEPEAGASTDKPLEDLYINYDLLKNEALQVRFGQYKVPLGRQENTTSIGLQFCDRSLLTFEFTRGRDRGVELWGRLADKKVTWWAGMFNGNPASRTENENTKFQYNARVAFEPWGSVGKSEGDFESKDHPLVAVAAQFENNNLFGATGGLGGQGPSDLDTTIFGGDLVFKFKGFSLFGEYFHRSRRPEQGETYQSPGYNIQAGYFLVRNRLEVAFRYAGWDPTSLIDGNDRTEIGGVLNVFLRGHRFKFQADFRRLEDKARDQTTQELRVESYVGF